VNEGEQRAVLPRIGIAALNLLSPGLGLLRVQRLKPALAFLFAPHLLLVLLIVLFASMPMLGFADWAGLMLFLLLAIATVYVGSIVWSWRASRQAQAPGQWWSRWYGIVGVVLLVVAVGNLLPDTARSYYRTFYLPSEAMMPGLQVNDRLVASMREVDRLRRGDIIIFEVGVSIYIKRVAALPGDRIEMLNGTVILNGRPVPQRFLGTDRVEPNLYGTEARRLSEQFPGEPGPHEIYDMGYSRGDDMAEQRVAPGHVFVLGDNRDRSADSRFPRSEFGVEQLPIADIRGRALFYLWGPSGRMGEPLNR